MYQNTTDTAPATNTNTPPQSVHALSQEVQQLKAQLATISPGGAAQQWRKTKGKNKGAKGKDKFKGKSKSYCRGRLRVAFCLCRISLS